MAEAYGWTPDMVGKLSDRQIRMYLAVPDEASRADDWSKFGLTRDGDTLRGKDDAMAAYMEHRRKLKEAA